MTKSRPDDLSAIQLPVYTGSKLQLGKKANREGYKEEEAGPEDGLCVCIYASVCSYWSACLLQEDRDSFTALSSIYNLQPF